MSSTTFYLRGIDLVDLAQKYVQGQFTQMTTTLSVSTNTTVNTSQVISVTPKSTLAARNHEFTNESGRSFMYIGYQIKDGGKYGEISPGQPANCMNCLKKVDPKHARGIPISKDSGSHIKRSYGVDTIYHCIDIFCWYRCAKTELRKRLRYSNNIYAYSMVYMAEMYESDEGKTFSDLEPAPDNRLLKIFNGPMDYEEYHGDLKYSAKPENIYYLAVVQSLERDV